MLIIKERGIVWDSNYLSLCVEARGGEINVADVNGVVIAHSDEVILSVTLQLSMLHQPIIHVIIFSNLPGDISVISHMLSGWSSVLELVDSGEFSPWTNYHSVNTQYILLH